MSMTNLEKKLYTYGEGMKKVSPSKRNQNILNIMKLEQKSNLKNSYFSFLAAQMKMLSKYCVFWQIIWLVGVYLLFYHGESFTLLCHSQLVLISILPPLVVFLSVSDVLRLFQQSMLEIECTTKYRIEDVVLIRFLAVMGMNCIVVLIGLLGIRRTVTTDMLALLLYGFTPMAVANTLLLLCMRFQAVEDLRITSSAIYVLILVLCMCGDSYKQIGIYENEYQVIWEGVLLLSIVVGLIAMIQLRKDLKRNGVSFKANYQKV